VAHHPDSTLIARLEEEGPPKRFFLVCKDLAIFGSRDMLWRDVGLSRQKLLEQEVGEEMAMIKMDRPIRMKKIYIKDYVDDSLGNDEAQTRTIVRNVLQYSCAIEHVRELSNLVNIGLLLTGCVLKLHTLNLRYCQLDKDDLLAHVSTIHSLDTLKKINLSCMDLSCLPPTC
jgi:hypothetical protein